MKIDNFKLQPYFPGHINNFDLIRLFAALQVAIIHCAEHLKFRGPWVDIFALFPGVPIFFFISGFLIFQSWANIKNRRIFIFFANRALRIFPALYFCVGLSVLSLFLSGFLLLDELKEPRFWLWILSQITAFQFFNPDFLRNYGVGVVNGSLWTISVELQFYLLTPFLFILIRRGKATFPVAILLFFLLNLANTYLNPSITIPQKIFGISFLPWFGMFMVGAYFSTSSKLQKKVIQVPWGLLIFPYVIFYIIFVFGGAGYGNNINPLSYLILAALILKIAFCKPWLSNKLLRRNDISYGIYIFHMPIVNFLIYSELKGIIGFWIAIFGTIVFALISWFLIERPALRLKKVALRAFK